MGKGRGCVPSKPGKKTSAPPPSALRISDPGKPQVIATDEVGDDEGGAPQPALSSSSSSAKPPASTHSGDVAPVSAPARDLAPGSSSSSSNLKIYIIYYSMYGHVEALARRIKGGVNSVQGVEGHLFRVPETFSASELKRMEAPPTSRNIPEISAKELPAADAFIFGFPTRFGGMAAQMKAFFDSTGSLWRTQKLAGKPAGLFVSTGTQGGGQETTAWSAITQLVHHGMLYVPVGYTFGAGMFGLDELRGGSPYGAGTYAGDGTKPPSELELAFAEHQGRYTAGIVHRLLSGG